MLSARSQFGFHVPRQHRLEVLQACGVRKLRVQPGQIRMRSMPLALAVSISEYRLALDDRAGSSTSISSSIVLMAPADLSPHDLVERLSLRQFVDQLVQVADFLHQRVGYFF